MLAQEIRGAERVLVGIGNEMQAKLQTLKDMPNFAKKLVQLECGQETEWLRPFLIRYYLRKEFHPQIMEAYGGLRELLGDVDFFVVSLCTDDLIRAACLREDRVVTPCGTYHLLQCEHNCAGKLYPIEDEFWAGVCGWVEGRISITELSEPKCPDCGAPLVMNQYGMPAYHEKGYLENWQKYTKWLQGTVNRRLCILELGAGMEFPSIVRWPFEKVCFYNQKSSFWRVHSTLYQLSEEIAERGTSVQENPVTFLGEFNHTIVEE